MTRPSAGQTRRRTGSRQANRAHAHQHGRRELEQQADSDRQPVDGDEVQPLHEREADDAVERKADELAPRADAEPGRGEHREPDGEPDEGAGGAQLRPAKGADGAGVQGQLRHGSVHREQGRRQQGHHVAGARMTTGGEGAGRKGELRHGARLSVAARRERHCTVHRGRPGLGLSGPLSTMTIWKSASGAADAGRRYPARSFIALIAWPSGLVQELSEGLRRRLPPDVMRRGESAGISEAQSRCRVVQRPKGCAVCRLRRTVPSRCDAMGSSPMFPLEEKRSRPTRQRPQSCGDPR